MSKLRTRPHESPSPVEASGRITERQLLGEDYARTLASGILNRFCDGAIIHILAGQATAGFVNGYHHEASGSAWDDRFSRHNFHATAVMKTDAGEHPAGGNRTGPYMAKVMIGGMLRTSLRRTGPDTTEVVPSLNTMFPLNFSALEVLQATIKAHDGRDRHTERLEGIRGVSWGIAPATPHSEMMEIKTVWDLRDGRIITAAPVLPPAERALARAANAGYLASSITV